MRGRIWALILAMTLILGLALPASAVDSTITFRGAEIGFDFQPGSSYTATDLFDQFKNVMPGDQLVQSIRVENLARDCDYIRLYLRAVPHDAADNPPIYDEAFENANGKDQAQIPGQRDETVATMADFLAQLTMRIYNGQNLIYESSPDQAGALAENVPLGTLAQGEHMDLRVELDVPLNLDNAYADRVGEVDWVFLAECVEWEKLTVHKVWDDNGCPDRPQSVEVDLLRDGEVAETVTLTAENQWSYTWENLDDRYTWMVAEAVPAGYEASYHWEDNRVFITNHRDYTPPEPADPVELTVVKVWADGDRGAEHRPEQISVTLYNGDTPVEKVILSQENRWTHTWKNLDGDGDWSVLETGVPKGYTPSYWAANGVVTITNTATLIQTGQLTWPILALGGLGLVFLAGGLLLRRKEERENG